MLNGNIQCKKQVPTSIHSAHYPWCMVVSSRIYPPSLFWSCYQYSLEFILTQLQTFKEIIIMKIWLLRCININAFCRCISVYLYKEPPFFDKSTLWGYTHHLIVQVGYHHILSTSTFISSSFFSTPFTERLMLLISIFYIFWLFHLRSQIFSSPAEVQSFSKSSPFLTVILIGDGYYLHG